MRLPACRRLLLFFALVTAAMAADDKPSTIDPFTPIGPTPELVTFASAASIPLRGIELDQADPSLAPGQSVTLLLALTKGQKTEQYMIRLTTDRLTESERSRPLPPDAVIHTSTGRTLAYSHSRAALRVELVGPFSLQPSEAGSAKVMTRTARAIVNEKYLQAGIAQYCRDGLDIARRIERAGIKNPIYFAGSGRPSPEDVAKGRLFSDPIQLTEEEERAAFSVYFSLTTFFSAAMEIPAVRDLLIEVVDMPSVWSIVRHLGVRTDFHYFWLDARSIIDDLAGAPLPAYQLPVRVYLNGKLGAKATFAVTSPRGPLTTTAGIFALTAEHPTDASRRLFIRVIAAGSGK